MAVMTEVITLSDDDEPMQASSSSTSPNNFFRDSPVQNNNPNVLPTSSGMRQTPSNQVANGFRPNVTSSRVQMGGGTGTVTITEKPLDLTALFAGSSDPPAALTSGVPSLRRGLVGANNQMNNTRLGRIVAATNSRLSLPARPTNDHTFRGNLVDSKKISDNTIDLSKINTAEANRKRLLPPVTLNATLPTAVTVPEKRSRMQYIPAIKAIHGYNTYQVSEPPPGSLLHDNDEYTGQFRCTALNCNKILPNNVSFMFHMWAHVVYFTRREYSNDTSLMTDEKFLRMCPCCWNVFENAYDRTQHYLYVHRNVFQSQTLCHVCEVVDFDGQHREKLQHKATELPFECRKCKFRTSSRMGLIEHFYKVHICTTLVICPFCPFAATISTGERTRGMATVKTYVAHILDHASSIHKKCSSCSYKFTTSGLFEKHVNCHQTENHKYPITAKTFKSLKNDMNTPRPRMDALTLLKCVECDSRFPKAENHFGKKQKCKRCDYQTNCKQAFYNHSYNTPCDPWYNQRSGLTDLMKNLNLDENLKPVPIPKGYTPSICKSKEFYQNFGAFRNFSFDREPRGGPPPKVETDVERRERIRQMLHDLTLPRKVKALSENSAENLAEFVFEGKNKREDTIKYLKTINKPFDSIFSKAMEQAKKLNED